MKLRTNAHVMICALAALASNGCSSDTASDSAGAPAAAGPGGNASVSLGGAQDFGLFRQILEDGQIPLSLASAESSEDLSAVVAQSQGRSRQPEHQNDVQDRNDRRHQVTTARQPGKPNPRRERQSHEDGRCPGTQLLRHQSAHKEQREHNDGDPRGNRHRAHGVRAP